MARGDLGGQRGDRELSALGWSFAALYRWEGVIRVVGGEKGENLVPWGGVMPYCATDRPTDRPMDRPTVNQRFAWLRLATKNENTFFLIICKKMCSIQDFS